MSNKEIVLSEADIRSLVFGNIPAARDPYRVTHAEARTTFSASEGHWESIRLSLDWEATRFVQRLRLDEATEPA